MRPSLACRIVRLSAWLAPRERRAAWTEEWLAEIEATGTGPAAFPHAVVLRALGAPVDALMVRALALREALREWREGLTPDARQALRIFRSHPGHAVAVAGCLGLGLTTALGTFSVVSGLLFAPFPGITNRSSLSSVHVEQLGAYGSPFVTLDAEDFELIRKSVSSIELAAEGVLNLAARVQDEAVPVRVAFVSGNYFSLLGTRAEDGRLIQPSDDQSDGFVAVVSQRFRSLRLGETWNGRLTVSGQNLAVVGVAEARFAGADGRSALHDAFAPIDVWVPLSIAPAWTDAGPVAARLSLSVLARLPNGVSNDDAERLLQPAGSTLAAADGRQRTVHLQRFGYPRDSTPATMALFVATMMAAPLIVVAIACANVANLRLARASARVRDLAVRLSLGATRAQLVRLLVLESIVLAAAGTAVGAFGAWAALRVLTARVPLPLDLDLKVILFTIGLMAGVTVLSGMAPALVTTRRLIQAGLRQTVRGGGPSHSRFRHVMVAAQVALSLALLVVAALLTRSLQQTLAAQPDLASEVLVVDVDLSRLGDDRVAARRFADELTARLSADSRVQSAGYSDQSLFGGRDLSFVVPDTNEARGQAEAVHVTPEWFTVFGVETMAGRTLVHTDRAATVAVVDANLASRLAPGGSPVGMTLRLQPDARKPESDTLVQIVGVVSNAMTNPTSTSRRPDPVIYLPLATPLIGGRDFPTPFTLFVRTADPLLVRRDVARLITELEPRAPWTRIETIDAIVSGRRSGERRAMVALGAVGLLALALAATGLYAAVAYLVSLRSREIGIRLALGARPRQAAFVVVHRALAPVVSGVVCGLIIALVTAQVLRSSFRGISWFDPVAILIAVVVLVLVAIAAAAVPAAHAARIDPVRVLRSE